MEESYGTFVWLNIFSLGTLGKKLLVKTCPAVRLAPRRARGRGRASPRLGLGSDGLMEVGKESWQRGNVKARPGCNTGQSV